MYHEDDGTVASEFFLGLGIAYDLSPVDYGHPSHLRNAMRDARLSIFPGRGPSCGRRC
eukprot:gene809-3708_t